MHRLTTRMKKRESNFTYSTISLALDL